MMCTTPPARATSPARRRFSRMAKSSSAQRSVRATHPARRECSGDRPSSPSHGGTKSSAPPRG